MKLALSHRCEIPNLVLDSQLTGRKRIFRDRNHAGEVLAALLSEYRGSDAWVMAIPAGGVPVAAVLSRRLELPCDLAVVSKVTLPWDREAGYGAVAFDGTVEINEPLVQELGLRDLELRYGIARTKAKVERRVRELRGEKGYEHLNRRTVILVDDGLASGFTLLAAISALRHVGSRAIVVAVPTASHDSAEAIASAVDRLFCANLRGGFPFAVADAYHRWSDVSEEELRRLVSELVFRKHG